jgi:hypothetical protein
VLSNGALASRLGRMERFYEHLKQKNEAMQPVAPCDGKLKTILKMEKDGSKDNAHASSNKEASSPLAKLMSGNNAS